MVVADMSGTRFCDSSGIRELVLAHKPARPSNTVFRVVAGPGEVRRSWEYCIWTRCRRCARWTLPWSPVTRGGSSDRLIVCDRVGCRASSQGGRGLFGT